MIIGIGCDIVNINRIEKLFKKFGQKFLNRILTVGELTNLPDNEASIIRHVAKRFAAKESVAKALGIGIGKINFNEIEIYNNVHGAPLVRILKEIDQVISIEKIHLSLSDEKELAMAFAVIERSSS